MTLRHEDIAEISQRDSSPKPMPFRRSAWVASLHKRSTAPSPEPASIPSISTSDDDDLTPHIRSMSVYHSPPAPPRNPPTPLGTIGKLPPELRTIIYNFVVPPPAPISFPASAAAPSTPRTGHSTVAALMSSSSAFRTEIFPLLYECRHIVFISSTARLEMCIDNQKVDLCAVNLHNRLSKLAIHTITIYLEPDFFSSSPLICRSHLERLQDLVYALKNASSIKCLHIRFSGEFQCSTPHIVRLIEDHFIETYLNLIVKIEPLHHIPEVHIHNMVPQTFLDQNEWMRDVQRVAATRLKENLTVKYKTWRDTKRLSVRSVFGLRLPISEMRFGSYSLAGSELYSGHPCKEGCTGDCWAYGERDNGME